MNRLRCMRRGTDDGFALIFVLLVTTMVMIAVGTTLTITTPNITNSKRSQDSAAALLAAQSGVDDAIAYLSNVPACRSETRICPQALGANSANLAGTSYQRPTLGTQQSFSWTTAASATPDGYVRVTSVGSEGGTKRTLVADLSLSPSILAYGYYTDYESQSPAFFNSYYTKRNIDITDSTTYGNVSSSIRGNSTVPQVATWAGASASASTGYPDTVCGQHYYSDGSNSPGRYQTNGTIWQESGTLNSKATTHQGGCDLVFTTGMVENGPTYTRDALLISDAGGSGPVFQQPVYTLWGYPGHTTPTPTAGQYYRQNVAGDKPSNTGYSPVIATSDITLPTSIGTDGIENNSCVYYGPTRVKLNGDGTATVTSPATTATLANAAVTNGADSACYPTGLGAAGIIGYSLNYQTTGSGTVYVRNLNKPTGGWPTSSLTSTSPVSPSTEVLYIPPTVSGATTPDQANTSAATDSCTTSVTYSANNSAACSWSSVSTATDAGPYSGYQWTSYTNAQCGSAADTNRQLFECDYTGQTGTAAPAVNQAGGAYKAVRTAVQADLAKGTCLGGSGNDQLNCIALLLNNDLAPANNAAHRYVATAGVVGTPVSGTAQNVGSTPTNPDASDSMFTSVAGTPAQEAVTRTPISIAISRQTFSNGSWTTGSYQFAVTVTQSSWALTQAATGGQSYFPNTQDVTTYATGATSAGVAAGSTGTAQPGDLYVEGTNQGSLSLIADNNVELTGNITKGSGNDSSAANPVSITAGNDVRNYHPVSCVDQTAADINATTAGFCPNDLTGLTTNALISGSGTNATFAAQHPAAQYSNMSGTAARTIDAAVFTLTGSVRTDNYDRGNFIGNLTINGGIYQSHRGANGVQYSGSNNAVVRSGANLIYNYVDLQRAHLPYAPAASYSNNPRVWNVVSLSAGS